LQVRTRTHRATVVWRPCGGVVVGLEIGGLDGTKAIRSSLLSPPLL
jgi:hypothetical protein